MKTLSTLVVLLLLGNMSEGADDMNELSIVPEITDSVEAGSDLLMTCSYTSEVVRDVRWIDPEGNEIVSSDKRVLESEDSKLSMTLEMVSLEDEGIYTCEGFSTSANATIDVKRTVITFDPVAIIDTPDVQEFEIGDIAEVICNVQGNPEPEVLWRKNDDKFTLQEGSTNYLIEDITKDDEGFYTCKARQPNKGKVKDLKIEVKVLIPPEIINFDEEVTVNEGDDHALACDATGDPAPTYKWYTGDGTVKDEKTLYMEGSMLSLTNVTQGMNGQQFTCVAENKVEAVEATFQLTVYVKPYFTVTQNATTRENNGAILRCVAEGDPLPSVSFYRYGTRMKEPVATVPPETDSDYPVEDGAEYLPDEPEEPEYTTESTPAVLGQWAPSPPPTVIYNGNEAILRFESAYKADAGNYECRAKSDAGFDSVDVLLNVEYGPDATEPKSVFACKDQIAVLECLVDANPTPELSWGLREMPEGSNDMEPGKFVAFNASNPPEGITIERIGNILQLNVETSIVENPYKTYFCKAENVIDYVVVDGEIMRAPTPEAPQNVRVSEIGTRQATVSISPPPFALVPIETYTIIMVPTAHGLKVETQHVEGSMQNYTFTDLEHNTEYTVSVSATNCADTGPANTDTKFMTKAILDPEPVEIISGKASEHHDKYTVQWNLNGRGGGEITKIAISVNKVEKNIDSNETKSTAFGDEYVVQPGDDSFVEGSHVIEDLDPGSDYEIIVTVFNEVGSADAKRMFSTAISIDLVEAQINVSTSHVAKTELPPVGSAQYDRESKPDVATGSISLGIIIIIIIVFLILLVVIDLTCFFTRSWGVTMWVYSHSCGKSQKHKVQDPEEGSAEYRQGQEGKYREEGGVEGACAVKEEEEKIPLANEAEPVANGELTASKLEPINEQTPLRTDDQVPPVSEGNGNATEGVKEPTPEPDSVNTDKEKHQPSPEEESLVQDSSKADEKDA